MPSIAASGGPRHYLALDGGRGLAACAVALFHFRSVFRISVNSHVGSFPLIDNAWLGVDFFFVLSGFVVAANYQHKLMNGTVRLRDFVLLRLGRLYPLHFVALFVTVLIVLFLGFGASGATRLELPPDQFAPAAFFANLFLFHGVHVGRTIGWSQWNHPSWSVSAELVTYMIFALSWRCLRGFAWFVTGLTIVVAPIVILALHGNLDVTSDFGIFRAMLGFALGVLVLNVAQNDMASAVLEQLTAGEATAAELVISALTVALVWGAGRTPLSMAAPYLFAGVVLLFSQEMGIVSRALKSLPMQALGRWSYSIYMLHYPLQLVLMFVAVWIGTHGGHALFGVVHGPAGNEAVLGRSPFAGDVANVLMMTLLVGISSVAYRVIEQPWRERIRAYVYSRRDDSHA